MRTNPGLHTTQAHSRPSAGRFEARLRDGRIITVSRLAARSSPGRSRGAVFPGVGSHGPEGATLPVGWQARESDSGGRALGSAGFAPVPTRPGHAIAEVVVRPRLAGTGLGLLLLETMVLAASESGLGALTIFLPAGIEDFEPLVARLGGRLLPAHRGVQVCEIPLAPARRRYLRSGTHRSPA